MVNVIFTTKYKHSYSNESNINIILATTLLIQTVASYNSYVKENFCVLFKIKFE